MTDWRPQGTVRLTTVFVDKINTVSIYFSLSGACLRSLNFFSLMLNGTVLLSGQVNIADAAAEYMGR